MLMGAQVMIMNGFTWLKATITLFTPYLFFEQPQRNGSFFKNCAELLAT